MRQSSRLALIVTASVVALAIVMLTGCGSGNADRAVCHIANSNASNPSTDNAGQMDGVDGGASPALVQLVTNLDNAVTAYQNATIGDAASAIAGEYKAFNAITAWCQSHRYGS